MMEKAVIGIDIGGTNTAVGYVNFKGEIIADCFLPTQGHQNFNFYIDILSKEIKNIIDKFSDKYEFSGIGIGVPNGNFYTGKVEYAPNLGWEEEVNLAEIFKLKFNAPVFITNDANAAALGEQIFGGAKGMNDFIVITLGTGLGSGFVANGKLIYGNDGFAGELGHIIVKENGRTCGCGRKGCLETYVSATGIKRTVFELLADKNFESEIRNIPFNNLSSKDIYEFALKGDKIALEAFDITAKILAKSLADVIAITSPEAIFLFGGLSNSEEFLLTPLRKYVENYLLKVFQNKVKIVKSELIDKNAAILGAASLIWNEITI